MSLLPRDPLPPTTPSAIDYLFGAIVWAASALGSLILALMGVDWILPKPPSFFGYELIPCAAAPVFATIAFAVILRRSSTWPFALPPWIFVSGVLATPIGTVFTLIGYWLLLRVP